MQKMGIVYYSVDNFLLKNVICAFSANTFKECACLKKTDIKLSYFPYILVTGKRQRKSFSTVYSYVFGSQILTFIALPILQKQIVR